VNDPLDRLAHAPIGNALLKPVLRGVAQSAWRCKSCGVVLYAPRGPIREGVAWSVCVDCEPRR
jgi:hypothetical protein